MLCVRYGLYISICIVLEQDCILPQGLSIKVQEGEENEYYS